MTSNRKWTAADLLRLDGRTFVVTGANTQDIPGGTYVGPDGFREGRGHPTIVGRSSAAADGDAARRLRELSEHQTGVTFGLAATV